MIGFNIISLEYLHAQMLQIERERGTKRKKQSPKAKDQKWDAFVICI